MIVEYSRQAFTASLSVMFLLAVIVWAFHDMTETAAMLLLIVIAAAQIVSEYDHR